MTETKPLHVRVAEALGWTRVHYRGGDPHGCGDIMLPDPERMRWKGRAPDEMVIGADCNTIPRFDIDWSATGPLIEKHASSVTEAVDQSCWNALSKWGLIPLMASGPTPLIAACNLVLLLKEAGKL